MIPSIQGLRGLSILLVFLSHWFAGAKSAGFLPEQWSAVLAVLNFGKYGVELFFMISGFVIVKSLERHDDIVAFGIDRIARIYPVFLALHFFIFIAGPLIAHKFFNGVGVLEWLKLFVTNVLLLPGVLDLPIAQIVAWSLSYEVLFYSFAAIAYAVRRPKGGVIALPLLVLVLVGGFAFVWYRPRALFFLPGVLAYFALQSHRFRWPLSGGTGVVGIVGFLILWSRISPESGGTLPELFFQSPLSGLYFLAAWLGAAAFFFQVLFDDGFLRRWMGSRWLVALGEISYSFYLLHVIVIFPLKLVSARLLQPLLGSELAFTVFGITAFALTYGLSVFSRQWLEVAAGEQLKQFLHRLRARSAGTPQLP